MTKKTLKTLLATALAGSAFAFSAQAAQLTVGFSQIGSESGWRAAETSVSKSEAKKREVNFKIADAQQKQENQIKAIRSFIAQKVDIIAFSPVVESGFETVLREAKAAKIPVILTDRAVNVKDDTLYVTFMGSDFLEEGRKAGRWLTEYIAPRGVWITLPAPTMICRVTRNGMSTSASLENSPCRLTR